MGAQAAEVLDEAIYLASAPSRPRSSRVRRKPTICPPATATSVVTPGEVTARRVRSTSSAYSGRVSRSAQPGKR